MEHAQQNLCGNKVNANSGELNRMGELHICCVDTGIVFSLLMIIDLHVIALKAMHAVVEKHILE